LEADIGIDAMVALVERTLDAIDWGPQALFHRWAFGGGGRAKSRRKC
jgi:hypothetical protein